MHISDTVVKPRTQKDENRRSKKSSSVAETLLAGFRQFLPIKTEEKTQEEEAARNYELLQSFRKKKQPIIYRVHPLPKIAVDENIKTDLDKLILCPYHVFVPRSQLPKLTSDLCRVKKVPEDRQHVNATSTSFLTRDESPVPELATELTVKALVLEDLLEKFATLDKDYFNISELHKTVYVSDSLRVSLGLKIGSKVSLWQVEDSEEVRPSSIDLFSWRNSVSSEDFEEYVKKHPIEGVLINSCAAIVLDSGGQCVLKISPENCAFAVVNDSVLENVLVHSRAVTRESLRLPERVDLENYTVRKASRR